jgi:hypothetical protein
MKPNEGSYAENAIRWGVSGLNIDRGRIGTNEKLKETKYPAGRAMCPGGGKRNTPEVKIIPNPQGRFPANLILECICDEVITEPTEIEDRKRTGGIWKTGGKETPMKTYKGGQQTHTNPECPCYMLDEQSGASSSSSSWRPPDKGGTGNTLTFPHKYGEDRGFNDTGGASRFFYIAKASRSERTHNRQIENQHPCIKPLKLMEYLCLLTKTPTGGIVLDPFAGSGTTLMAAKKQGRDFIGIEKEAEYVKIAEARLKAIPKSLF